LAVVIDRLKQR